MWREKGDGAGLLDRREPFDPIAVGGSASGHDNHVCALAATFEQARLKEIGGTRRVQATSAGSRWPVPGRGAC